MLAGHLTYAPLRLFFINAGFCRRAAVAASRSAVMPMVRRSMADIPTANRGKGVKSPVTWYGLGAIVLIGGGVSMYVHLERERRQEEFRKRRAAGTGLPDIGGPFELTRSNGKSFSDKSLRGKWVLLYFGFTFCPDICPDELDKLTEVLNALDKMPGIPEVQPVFISIDPIRANAVFHTRVDYKDTPEKLDEYIKDFHPRLIGLTGTEEQVKQVAKDYRVYYSKPDDAGDDYLVDHTIIQYLLGPDGGFKGYFGQLMTTEEMTEKMVKLIKDGIDDARRN